MLSYRRCGISLFVYAYLILCPLVPRLLLGQAVTVVYTGTRFAGTGSAGYNSDNGTAVAVALNAPSYIVFDSNGNQYLSDTLNNCVRKIDTAGNITTVVGLAVNGQSSDTCNAASNAAPTPAQGLYGPTGLAVDSTNRLYIADSMHHCIRSLASGSMGVASLVTVAGTCGTDPNASVTPAPNGLAIDRSNNLYISLQTQSGAAPVNQVVRHAATDAASAVCLVAGAASANVTATCGGVANGVALSGPSGLAIDINNNLFIADTGNQCVREIVGLTTAQTVVGQCTNDGTGSSSTDLRNPYGVAISPTQALIITELNPDNVVSYISGSGRLTPIAGLPSGIAGSYVPVQDGTSALNAPLNSPRGAAFDSLGRLFVADSQNNIMRELSSNTQFAATPVGNQSTTLPITFAVNQSANLSISSASDFTITSTTCAGALTSAAAGSPPNTCQIFGYFAPTRPGLRRATLRIVDSISGTSVFLGIQGTGTGALSVFTPGTSIAAATGLAAPVAIATDATGNVYVLEVGKTAGTADMVQLAGSAVIAAGQGLVTPSAMASDAAGNWFVADATHGSVARFGADGSINPAYIAGLDSPSALVSDRFGNLFVAQAGNSHNIVEVYSAGVRRVIAGSGANFSADGIAATNAAFVAPSALTMDLNGVLYIADQGGHRVYTVDQSGIIHIVAGDGTTTTTSAGQATGTALLAPVSLAVDAAGNLYIADQGASTIYAVYAAARSNIVAVLNDTSANAVSIALDANGNLFAANATANSVIEVNRTNPALNFGAVNVGTTSAALIEQIVNIGTDSLNLTKALSVTDSHFAMDSNTTTCGSPILPGSGCALGFTFAPTANVAYAATTVVASNSSNSSQSIQLTGTGRQVTALTITLPAETEIYGGSFSGAVVFNGTTTAPTGVITFSINGRTVCSVSGNLGASITCNGLSSHLNAGTYSVNFSYSGDNNYAGVSGTATLTVTPAPLTVKVAAATRAYDAANPAFNGTMTGIVPGDVILLAYTTNATMTSTVGSYPIYATLTPIYGTILSNYAIVNTPGSLRISPSTTLVVNVNSAVRAYGAMNPAFTSTVSGLVNNDSITIAYSTTATTGSSAGRYMISASVSGATAANYIPTVNQGALTIAPTATTTTMTTSNPTVIAGNSVTFTAQVTAIVGTVTGTVNFYDGTTLLGHGSVASGTAVYTTNALTVGLHKISAAYQATTNFDTSGSATVDESIAQPTGGFVITPVQTSQLIRGAGTTSYQINLQATGEFAGQVALTCSGLPADSTCSFSNATPTLTVGGSTTTIMKVTNTVADAKMKRPAAPRSDSFAPITAAAVFPFELTGLGVCFSGLRRRTSSSNQRHLLIILFMALGMIGLTGCGVVTTPSHSYTISVTGTSVSFPATPQTASVVFAVGVPVR